MYGLMFVGVLGLSLMDDGASRSANLPHILDPSLLKRALPSHVRALFTYEYS